MTSDKFQQTVDNFEELISEWRKPLIFLFLGLILVGFGVIYYKVSPGGESSSIEVLESSSSGRENGNDIVVEISGEVVKSGVYKLSHDSRVEDLLIASGGLSANADRDWIEIYVNRAAKLTDGQKVFIPRVGEQSEGGSAKNTGGIKVDQGVLGSGSVGLVNINTASVQELDALSGIGQVYAQNIIEHRLYSNIDELVSKGALPKNVYEKIRDKITIY
jgi:competence protein ComEA